VLFFFCGFTSSAYETNDLVRLNDQITIYNNSNTPDLPTAVSAGGKGPIKATGLSITLDVTGWTYLSLKWADTDQFYYVGNDSGDITFDSTVDNKQGVPQNLSGYDFFKPYYQFHSRWRLDSFDAGCGSVWLGSDESPLKEITRLVNSPWHPAKQDAIFLTIYFLMRRVELFSVNGIFITPDSLSMKRRCDRSSSDPVKEFCGSPHVFG